MKTEKIYTQILKVMKSKIFGIVVIAVILISTSALAQRPNQGPDQRPAFGNRGEGQVQQNREMHPRFQGMQFFTDEQREAIKKIRLATAKEMKPLRNKLNEMEAHQKTLATADKADMNAIYKNIEEIGKVKTDIAKVQAKERQDIRALLTDEQLLSFDNSRRNHFGGEMRRPGMNRMNQTERPGRRSVWKSELNVTF